MGSCGRIVFKKLFFFVYATLLFFIAAVSTEARESEDVTRVLIIHSYHEGFSWTEGIESGIREQLQTRKNTEIFTEYLDSKRWPLQTVAGPAVTYLKQKYRTVPPDLLIITDNNALTLLREHREDLFPCIPVVFCGINNYNSGLLEGFENRMTGVVEAVDPAGTVKLIRMLQPDLKRLIMISGITPTAQAVKKEVKKALEPLNQELELIWWDSLSTRELSSRLKGVSGQDAVLLILFNRDAKGTYYSYEEAARLIYSHSDAPIYGMWDFYLGNGVTGGMMANSRDQGQMAGKLALSVLKEGRIPKVVETSPNAAFFDYNTLKKHGLNPLRLPKEVEVRGRPIRPPYKWSVLLAVILSCMLIIIIMHSITIMIQPVWSKGRIKLSKLISRNLQGGITVLSACLLAALFTHSWLDYQSNIVEMRSSLLEHKKELLVTMVNQAMDQIAFERSNRDGNEELIKMEIRKRLSNISFANSEGYIFATTYQGISLVYRPNPKVVGTNIYDLTDPTGVRFVEELIKAAKKPRGGFVSYAWNKPSLGKTVEKLSYARSYQDWGWMIGTGLYIDDIETVISQRKDVLKQSLIIDTLIILGLGLLSVSSMTVISRFLSRAISRELHKLINGINEKSGTSENLNPGYFQIEEFSHIAGGTARAFSTVIQLQTNLRNFFDTVNDFLFVLDADGRIIEVNNTVTRRLGYNSDELAGHPVLNVHPASRRKETKQMVAEMLAGRADICTIPLLSKNDDLIDVETTIQKGEWNGSPAFFGVSKDVSKLKRSEERLANVIHGTNIGTWEWNVPSGELVFNERWAGIIGYTLEELAPVSIQTWLNRTHPDDHKQSESQLKAHFYGRCQVYECECRMKHKDGSWVWVHNRGRVVSRTDDGRPLMMSGTIADITDRKLADEKLQKTLIETSRLNRLMNGRELRIIEMKKEVNSLLKELGREFKYRSVEESNET